MSTIARKLLILLLAGAGLAAAPQLRAARQTAPAPAVSELAPAAESCGPPPPVVPRRRPRPEEEGCTETPPSPALARR